MSATSASPAASDRAAGVLSLGFLTVVREANGYLGGYLVSNGWGRPLEFRLTSAVQPNRVQQILYGGTLEPYICADLIGKTLVDKAGIPVQLVLTDRAEMLDLRMKLDVPVVWLAPADAAGDSIGRRGAAGVRGAVRSVHPRFTPTPRQCAASWSGWMPTFDLAEPFQRIREAIGEARKMGVAAR